MQWEFADAEPWHVRVDNGSTGAAAGLAPHVDVELRGRYADLVDSSRAGWSAPRVATRRLRRTVAARAVGRARAF